MGTTQSAAKQPEPLAQATPTTADEMHRAIRAGVDRAALRRSGTQRALATLFECVSQSQRSSSSQPAAGRELDDYDCACVLDSVAAASFSVAAAIEHFSALPSPAVPLTLESGVQLTAGNEVARLVGDVRPIVHALCNGEPSNPAGTYQRRFMRQLDVSIVHQMMSANQIDAVIAVFDSVARECCTQMAFYVANYPQLLKQRSYDHETFARQWEQLVPAIVPTASLAMARVWYELGRASIVFTNAYLPHHREYVRQLRTTRTVDHLRTAFPNAQPLRLLDAHNSDIIDTLRVFAMAPERVATITAQSHQHRLPASVLATMAQTRHLLLRQASTLHASAHVDAEALAAEVPPPPLPTCPSLPGAVFSDAPRWIGVTDMRVAARLRRGDGSLLSTYRDVVDVEAADVQQVLHSVFDAWGERDDRIPRVQRALPAGSDARHLRLFAADHRVAPGEPCFATMDGFARKWREFSCGVLDGFVSPHAWVIGGSVVACLQPGDSAAPSSVNRDIDVAFVGVHHSVIRLLTRFDYFMRAKHPEHLALRTPASITYVLPYPLPRVQVLIGMWSTVRNLLSFADIDCCAVAMSLAGPPQLQHQRRQGGRGDGDEADDVGAPSSWTPLPGRVVLTPRAMHSWLYRVNVPTRRSHGIRGSIQYEERLLKYARRDGFAVVHFDIAGDGELARRLRDPATASSLRMPLSSGLAWLYLCEQGTFNPRTPPSALDVSPTRDLAAVCDQVEEDGFEESDGYGAHSHGYQVMPTVPLPEVGTAGSAAIGANASAPYGEPETWELHDGDVTYCSTFPCLRTQWMATIDPMYERQVEVEAWDVNVCAPSQ